MTWAEKDARFQMLQQRQAEARARREASAARVEAKRARQRERARARYRVALPLTVRVEAHRRLPLACEICGETSRLAIDHDHATGDVRGRLCSGCNTGIGVFRERDELLLRAVAYLRKYRKAVA